MKNEDDAPLGDSSGTHARRPPRLAAEMFGERLPLAVRYADLLVSTGIEHGLVGPREAPKIWDRHIINCAMMESLLPHRARLIDIGSGAGLPGLVLAIARPDLRISLIEPLARRTDWLLRAIDEIGLPHVTVHRARAEEMGALIQAPVVTARAVAKLDQLVAWSWPLMPMGGRLLALKGQTAAEELRGAMSKMEQHGVSHTAVHSLGADVLEQPVRVVEVIRGPIATSTNSARGGGGNRRAHMRSGRKPA
ncbi:MAG: 16S rRNA (guanine(527)-N(7))-methyltransferase RsmG [Ornithinimicrobium sp.]